MKNKKFKYLAVLSFVCISAAAAHAQANNDPALRKIYLDFGGSVGLFIPVDNAKNATTKNGSNAITALQLNYHQNYLLRLQFGQTTVNFKSQNQFGTVASSVNAKANSTNLGLAGGYQRTYGRWQPFVVAGAGVSFIDVPATNFNGFTQTVSFSTVSGQYLYFNIGTGINYKVSRSFTVFLEAQGSTIPELPKNSATHLSGISALIGIKAPL